jgi:cytochrome c2
LSRPVAASLPAQARTRAEPPASIWHPGTNMAFVGFKKPADSADVVAFLNKNK